MESTAKASVDHGRRLMVFASQFLPGLNPLLNLPHDCPAPKAFFITVAPLDLLVLCRLRHLSDCWSSRMRSGTSENEAQGDPQDRAGADACLEQTSEAVGGTQPRLQRTGFSLSVKAGGEAVSAA
jgi:hypothetical protein